MQYEIKEDNDYLKDIFDTIFDEVVIISINYEINAVNKAFCIKYKTTKEQAVGSKCYQIIHGLEHPCNLQTCDCIVEKVLKTGESAAETHFHNVDETVFYIEQKAYPIKFSDGNISHVVKIGRDITDFKKLEGESSASNENLNLILSKVKDSIFVISEDHEVLYMNNEAVEYFKENFIGNKCYERIFNQNEPCDLCPIKELTLTKNCYFRFEKAIPCQMSKKMIYFDIKCAIIENYHGKKVIVEIMRDVTIENEIKEKLKESEEKLHLILSNINDSVVVISKSFNILYMNEKAEEQFGTSLLGKVCYENLMNRDGICKECSFNKLISNYNKDIRFETVFKYPISTEKKYYEFSCTPIIYYNGEPALIDIIRDITDRKKIENYLRESEEKSRKLLENIPYSIILLDSKKKIYDCNSVVEIYLNKPSEDILKRDLFEIFPLSNKQINSVNEIIHNAFEYDLKELIVLKFTTNSNNKTWIEAFFSSVEIGGKKLIQIILHDITEQKYAEKIVKEESKRLKELDQVKKNLTVQTSEELKSPLAVMFDASQILLNSYKDKLDNNAIRLLERIKNGGEKSISLVERIVDISKIETDKLDLKKQTESLFEIIRESVDGIMSLIKKYNFNLNLNLLEDLYSDVDKVRISQVLKDLILNLIKYTSKNGEISISLSEKNNYAEISLKNDGFNLSRSEKESQSLEEYEELSQESIFGLYFSKEIIELHGGQIIIKSEEQSKKTEVKIQLPLKKWTDQLIEIYILYRSGIPLYNHSFIEKSGTHDPTLISGSIIGILTILKEVFQGEKQMKIIDHGDRKLLFGSNNTEDVIFVLVAKDDLIVFHRKLNALIEEFDNNFKELIINIQNTCSVSQNWENLGELVQKHFLK